MEEAASIPRIHTALQRIVAADLGALPEDDDADVSRAMEELDRATAGSLIPHHEVNRRLHPSNDR